MSKIQQDFSINEFAELIAVMSRFLTGLSSVFPLSKGRLGLSEWVALSVLSQSQGIGNNQLAKNLGVSSQRANQITTSLATEGFISIKPSLVDTRKKEISVTQVGASELSAVEEQMIKLINEVFCGATLFLADFAEAYSSPIKANIASKTAQ